MKETPDGIPFAKRKMIKGYGYTLLPQKNKHSVQDVRMAECYIRDFEPRPVKVQTIWLPADETKRQKYPLPQFTYRTQTPSGNLSHVAVAAWAAWYWNDEEVQLSMYPGNVGGDDPLNEPLVKVKTSEGIFTVSWSDFIETLIINHKP